MVTHNFRWKILKGSVDVMVTEGNTDLGSNSLVIKGYDVNGYVKSSNEYVKDVVFILSKQKDVKHLIMISLYS